MRILVGINTLTAVNQLAYSNHMQIFYRLGRNHPDKEFVLFTPPRMSIDAMRNFSCRAALENECDYVMFIDDDVLVPITSQDKVDFLGKMLQADKDIIAGYTVIRGYPYNNMFFKGIEDKDGKRSMPHLNDYENLTDENGLVECDAIGCSLVLFKVSVLKKIPPPYFVTGTLHTEDVYFCMKAKKYIPDISIFVDTTIETGHILNPQVVTAKNKIQWKEFEELLDPEIIPVKKEGNNRQEEYLHQCLTFKD